MKKLLALILITLILLSLVACNGTTKNDNSGSVDTDNDGSVNTNDHTENKANKNCTIHNYIDNICSICGCSLWNEETDITWYNTIDLEFTISTAEQFAGLIDIVNHGSNLENVKISLANHIDMNGTPITPIGATSETVFAGTFDGNEYSISNVTINTSSVASGDYATLVGLFGHCKGDIFNLNINNLNIDINSETIKKLDVGGIAAYSESIIYNCSVSGIFSIHITGDFAIGGISAFSYGDISQCKTNIKIDANLSCSDYDGDNPRLGGLVAYLNKGTVSECISEAIISLNVALNEQRISSMYIGGLVGETYQSYIENCYSIVDIAGNYSDGIGGLVGQIRGGTIDSCYSCGKIEVSSPNRMVCCAGGIIGDTYTEDFWVRNCISLVDIASNGYSTTIGGGQLAKLYSDRIVNCYYHENQNITGKEILKNGTPANIADFKNINFYKNKMPWDAGIWSITDGEFPTLK